MSWISSFYQQIPEIEKKLHYHFHNPDYLVLACTHRSFWNEHQEELAGHNERLEFLGDSVIGFLVADYLYNAYEALPEGKLSELRSQLIRAESCAHFLTGLDLEKYLLLGKGEKINNGRGRQTILADFFEALLGAIYLDGGYKAAHHFFFHHFKKEIMQGTVAAEVNWKARLQEYVQSEFQEGPSYEILEESGPSHDKLFLIAVVVRGKRIAEGGGRSKKEAQVEAAKRAMEHYATLRRS